MFEYIRPQRFEPHSPDLTQASRELLKAAERDAGEIVAAARADVQRRVLKAQQELLALNAQVRTTINRFEGGRNGSLLEGSLVLREARRELEALSAERRPMNVVATETKPAPAAPARPMLSPYEMDNPRIRVKVPARAARTVKAVPAASMLLVVGLATAVWGWSHGWRIELTPPAQQAAAAASDEAAAGSSDAGATGMIGRTATPNAEKRAPDRPRSSGDRSESPTLPRVPEVSAIAPSASIPTAAGRQELLGAADRWLDAYYVKDSARLSALSAPTMTLSDERTAEEKLPGGLTGVRRTLSDATVQVFGADAIVTAKLSERDGSGRESSGFISQMWTRRSGAWQVTDVRIVSAAAVARAFRR
jgi:hypothetical protein